MQYRVRWFDPSASAIREDVVAAESADQLPARIDARFGSSGSVVLASQSLKAEASRSGRLDVGWWCRELRTLVMAGMTVVEALETVSAQPLGKARAEVNAGLVAKLHEGKALSTAMAEVGAFPSVLIASIKASERTSALVEALDDYLRYDEVIQRLRKQIVSAAIYPALVVTLGASITLLLLLFVVPRFSQMYRDLRGDISWATQALVSTSHALEHHGLAIAGGLVAVLWGLVWAWKTGRLLRLVERAALSVEPLQAQLDEYRFAKLYQSLTLMFRGGYPLDEALAQCTSLGLGPRLNPGIEAAQAALARGVRVSAAFGDAGLTDDVSARLLAVGERTGNFDRVLTTIGERHAANFTVFIERATRIAEPLLLLLVALVVGGIVVMMYMPIFDIASSLG